ncbi:hypothetical protein BC567DRAFT_239586 [Phyllosticta citribraziliensis]
MPFSCGRRAKGGWPAAVECSAHPGPTCVFPPGLGLVPFSASFHLLFGMYLGSTPPHFLF